MYIVGVESSLPFINKKKVDVKQKQLFRSYIYIYIYMYTSVKAR